MVTTVTDNSPQSINTSLFAMDSEIQKVKKIAESFDEKLSGIDIETGVLSVNGKQGVVELTASDVDALPSSTVIPTTTSELENTSGFITSSDSITGNAATATTADKVKNALTINGKTYDGSSAVNAGVQAIANGGTGASNGQDAFDNIVSGVRTSSNPVDNETMLIRNSTWYKTTVLSFWEYIKGKISSVLGLTASNYGGKAATAGTADMANALAHRGDITNTDTFQNVMNNDGKWYIPDLNLGWTGSLYSFHVGGSQSGLMFRIRGGSSDIRSIEVNYSIDSNRFAGPWMPLIGRIPTSAPSSPKDGDIWIQ